MDRTPLHHPRSLGVTFVLVAAVVVVASRAEVAVVQRVAYLKIGGDVVVAGMEVEVASALVAFLEPPREEVEVVRRVLVVEEQRHHRPLPLP